MTLTKACAVNHALDSACCSAGVLAMCQKLVLLSPQLRPVSSLTLCLKLPSDQRLPDGSGLDCVALIRLHVGRSVPAVTGDTAPADLALLAGAGLPVLHKPFSADALLQQALVATPGGAERQPGFGAPPRQCVLSLRRGGTQAQAQARHRQHRLGARVGVELAEDRGEMGLHG